MSNRSFRTAVTLSLLCGGLAGPVWADDPPAPSGGGGTPAAGTPPPPVPPPPSPPAASSGGSTTPAPGASGATGDASSGGADEPTFTAPDVNVTFVRPDEVVGSTPTGGVPITYPGGRTVLDRDVLDTYNFNDAVAVVRRVPGVNSQIDSGGPWRLNIGSRGSDSRRSGFAAVLVDGVPVNPAPYGSIDLDVFPLSLQRVERIDVLRGGQQVRYGPSSAGGVFNFITQPIPECGSDVTETLAYGSWNLWSEYLCANVTKGKWGAQATAVFTGGDSWRENGEYDTQEFAGKLRFRPDDKTEISAWGSYYHLDTGESGGLTQAAYDDDPRQSLRPRDRLEDDCGIAFLSIQRDLGCDTHVQLLGYYYDQFRSFDTDRPVVAPYDRRREQTAFFTNWTVEARFESIRVLAGHQHHFYQSFRFANEDNHLYYHARLFSDGSLVVPLEQNNDFYTHAFSSFTEDVIGLTSCLDLSLGLRYEHIEMGASARDLPDTNYAGHDIFLPAVSLTWKLDRGTAAYASYQESFTPAQFDSLDPTTVAYRPIDPERARTYEIGTRFERSAWRGSVAVYDTEYTNKINITNLPSGLKEYSNTGEERHYGLELDGRVDLGACTVLRGVSLYGAYAHQRTEILNGEFSGNDAPNAPRHLAAWGAEYHHPCCGLWARLGGTYTGHAYKERNNFTVGSANGVTGPQPSFTLWDLGVGWNQRADGTGLSAQINVTNLFDEKYYRRFALGIYPGDPTAFVATVSYTFQF